MVATVEDLVASMQRNPKNIQFSDLTKACNHFFGEARHIRTSHRIYKTPWSGDPRVNIQSAKGKAKAYQVKQVLLAIERIRYEDGEK
jgi:inorganic pyrophosphatase